MNPVLAARLEAAINAGNPRAADISGGREKDDEEGIGATICAIAERGAELIDNEPEQAS